MAVKLSPFFNDAQLDESGNPYVKYQQYFRQQFSMASPKSPSLLRSHDLAPVSVSCMLPSPT